MRNIGTLEDRQAAQRFADYLATQGITVTVDEDEEGKWELWVKEEDRVADGRQQLQQFRVAPQDDRYRVAEKKAAQLRLEQQQRVDRVKKNQVDLRRRWNRPMLQRAPAVTTLIGVSILVAVLTRLGDNFQSPVMQNLLFAFPPLQAKGWGVWNNIASGELWRLVTPIFIHFSPLHILFNMYILYLFGSALEIKQGTWFMFLFVLGTGAASNSLQALLAAPGAFGGMSGVDYALFGFIWYKTWYQPSAGYRLSNETVLILVAWLVFGFVLNRMPGASLHMANWAHLGGLASGWLVAQAMAYWSP